MAEAHSEPGARPRPTDEPKNGATVGVRSQRRDNYEAARAAPACRPVRLDRACRTRCTHDHGWTANNLHEGRYVAERVDVVEKVRELVRDLPHLRIQLLQLLFVQFDDTCAAHGAIAMMVACKPHVRGAVASRARDLRSV